MSTIINTCDVMLIDSKGKINKNCIIEFLDSYIFSLPASDVINVVDQKPVKRQLDCEIKIETEYPLAYTDNMGDERPRYDYCRIQRYTINRTINEDGTYSDDPKISQAVDYYFITGFETLSKKAYKLILHLDILNTLTIAGGLTTAFDLSRKTYIEREHCNRFYEREYFHAGDLDTNSATLIPDTHKLSEGFQCKLYERWDESLPIGNISEGELDDNWYIIFKTQTEDANSPLESFICADEPHDAEFSVPADYDDVDFSNTTSQYLYIFEGSIKYLNASWVINASQVNIDGRSYTLKSISIYGTTAYGILPNPKTKLRLMFIDEASKYILEKPFSWIQNYTKFSYFLEIPLENGYDTTITAPVVKKLVATASDNDAKLLPIYEIYNEPNVLRESIQDFISITTATKTIYPISTIDRTDPKLIKIIEMPYSPTILESCTYDTTMKMAKVNDMESKLIKKLVLDDWPADWRRIDRVDIKGNIKALNDNRKYIDPKVYHSDFYQPTFVYDSFSLPIRFEWIGNQESSIQDIEYQFSRTFKSQFMFKILNYGNDGKLVIDGTEPEVNYPNILIINRSNEVPIYNSDYLNYIRVGYNYDVKSKDLSNGKSFLSIPLATLAGAAAGGWAGAAAGFVSTTINWLFTAINNQNSLESKVAQLKNQAINVSQADSYDLMNSYAGNKLKFKLFQCSEEIEKMLDDLFYYFGYKVAKYDIPNFHSRVWFNYIQFTPILNRNIREEYRQELIDRCKEGITIYHRKQINGVNMWDLDQEKENWEYFLYNQAKL